MAGTVISNRLPPNIDITKAPLAYGQRALPKLVSIESVLNDQRSVHLFGHLIYCCLLESRAKW
jgi:hypothetical protein